MIDQSILVIVFIAILSIGIVVHVYGLRWEGENEVMNSCPNGCGSMNIYKTDAPEIFLFVCEQCGYKEYLP